jgi:pyruvate/2-oxoglutarate dehydrogenase complex dihydrolipoamide dehydrogenase (E3) component
VTVVERVARILEREEPDAAAVVDRSLRADGVDLVLGANVLRAERRGGDRVLVVEAGGTTREIACDAILVGVGRVPNVEGLGLEAAGVAHDRRGVTVDDHLRTTNPRIWAAGDIASRFQFTHVADFHARIVLTNALFLGRRKASALHIPACTYTSPELARVGLSAAEAAERNVAVDTITVPLHDVDRARLDGEDEGLLRVHVTRGSDRIVGATLVAAHAGDIISELTLAMATGIGLGRIANVIHPYPTVAEAIRKAGDAYNRTRLTPRVKRIFSLWLRFRP